MSQAFATRRPEEDASTPGPQASAGVGASDAALAQSAELNGQAAMGTPSAAQAQSAEVAGPRSWNQWLFGTDNDGAASDPPPETPEPVYTGQAYRCTDSAAYIRTPPPEARHVGRSVPEGALVVIVDQADAASRRTGTCVEVVAIDASGNLGQAYGWTKIGNLTAAEGELSLPEATARDLQGRNRPDLCLRVDGSPAGLDQPGDAVQPEPAAVAADGIEAIMDMCVGWESWVTWDSTVVDAMALLSGGERVYARTTPDLHAALAEKLGPGDFESALRNVDAGLLDLTAAHLTVGYTDYFSGRFADDIRAADLARIQGLLGMGVDAHLVASGVDPTSLGAITADPAVTSMMAADPAFRAWAMGANNWDAAAYETWSNSQLTGADAETRQAAFSTLSADEVQDKIDSRDYKGRKREAHRTRVNYENVDGGLSANLRADIYPTGRADDYAGAVEALTEEKSAQMSTGQKSLITKVEQYLAQKPAVEGAYAAFAEFEVPAHMNQAGDTVLDSELIDRMRQFVRFAAWAGLLVGKPAVTSGARSEKRCHQLSVNYMFSSGRGINDSGNRKTVAEWAVANNGTDLDGNKWVPDDLVSKLGAEDADDTVYQQVLLEEVKGTFSRRQADQAAEGYDRGDPKRMPNLRNTGKSLHAGRDGVAGAIDIAIPWVFSNRYDPMIDILALYFGLKRPVKDSSSSPEDWHYEKIGHVLTGDEVDEER